MGAHGDALYGGMLLDDHQRRVYDRPADQGSVRCSGLRRDRGYFCASSLDQYCHGLWPVSGRRDHSSFGELRENVFFCVYCYDGVFAEFKPASGGFLRFIGDI